MAIPKDYYQVLGVGKTATPEEIKLAYRKLAREHHPDMVKDGDKASAEQRFKEINEAYQVLSDPQKRKMFDQYGAAAFAGGAQNAGQGGFGGFGGQQGNWGPFSYSYTSGGNAQDFGFGNDFDPFDVFEQFFGFRGYGSQQRAPRKGKNLYYQIKISFAEAVFGMEKEVKVESGSVKIKIPSGIKSGMELRFADKGMPGPQGTPPGDLFLTVHIEAPQEFDFYDEYILVKKEISFVQAILGDNVEVPVVDLKSKNGIGTAKLKIPEGTQYGARFIIRGKGMPKLKGRGQGDVLVQVYMVTPKKVSRDQKDLLQKYMQVS